MDLPEIDMPTQLELIETEAMKLSAGERADLADRLWLSVHSREEIEAAWEEEIARRIQQIDSGEVECVPWDAAIARLRDEPA